MTRCEALDFLPPDERIASRPASPAAAEDHPRRRIEHPIS
jgi:hypothetical protein